MRIAEVGNEMDKLKKIRWQLVIYDLIIMGLIGVLIMTLSGSSITARGMLTQSVLSLFSIILVRIVTKVYLQIWRYGGIQCYIRLLTADGLAFVLFYLLERTIASEHLPFSELLAISCMNLLGSLAIRMVYRYAYKCGNDVTVEGKLLILLMRIFAGKGVIGERELKSNSINIAIVGAGRVGVSLAEELLSNSASSYQPRCFVDVNREKVGRDIHGIPVLLENEKTLHELKSREIQEVVFAIPNLPDVDKKRLCERYLQAGYKIKIYDYPTMQTAGSKRHLREFDIEELLFRKTIRVVDKTTSDYYTGKVILITGGGGSIGSELCRQIAKMQPKCLIVLDIYENSAYDIQQELRIAYPKLDVHVEIVSITNKRGLDRVFERYHPEIIINAAAHKHVPLMENNCIEAVENNVFGTLNVVRCCEEFGAARFMMVSTDKAVNPTNVMGATKRMCEMIMQAYSTTGKVRYSATRFGNVLGSAGSVIPLFKRQIAAGGPITLTDKRIIRYFMTIPEASQLVLASGAMAKNGELFVLDMGQPVRILDLAENMIRLSGVPGVEIIETGLRPGEKLYEELLVKTEELDKTENELIFIERDTPISMTQLQEKLEILKNAVAADDDNIVRTALRVAVPTFRTPEEVNAKASESAEMKKQLVNV